MRFVPLKNRSLVVVSVMAWAAVLAMFLAIKLVLTETGGSRVREDIPIARRHIEYRFVLQNVSTRLLKKAEFWTYGPVMKTATQRCTGLKANLPCDVNVDVLGNQILHFTFNNLPPFSTKLILVEADVELSSEFGKICEGSVDMFLGSEDRNESSRPEIRELAKLLKQPNPIQTAKSTFRWISENIRYSGFHSVDRGALYALRKKQGDCTEFMSLFVALCRANGIPARGIGGYSCLGDSILKPGNCHDWAEFFDGKRWRSVDPQGRVFENSGRGIVAMRIIGNPDLNPMGNLPRFRSDGEGVKVRMES